MASIGDVFLRLVLDDKDFQDQIVKGATKAGDKAGKGMSAAMGAALTSFGNDAMKVGKGMTKVGDSMTRNVTLPILAAGGATAKLALDFDTTMNQIVGLAKVPRDQIQGVRDDILKMAGDVGRSPQELAEAFYFVASAGFSADAAMKVLEISAKAAATGMGQTQDVAKVLGGVLNAYGQENLSAARAGDILTAAVQDGAAEASGFAGAIGQVVPTAAALGVSFDQVTAAMAAMTNVGVDVDTAATNLNQIFSSLLKPTKEADKALESVGLSAAGLRQELKDKGLLATLRTVQAAFEGNDEAIASVFGNIRALRGVNALLSLDEKQLTGIFNDTAGAVGNLGQAYDDTDGPQRQIAKSMADLQATAITIGEDVLPIVVEVLQQLAGGAKELAKWWKTLDPATKKSVVQWAAFLAVAGPVLSIVGRITTGIGGLSKGLGFLVTKLGGASKALGLTKLGFLGLAAGIVAAGVAYGSMLTDDIGRKVHEIFLQVAKDSGQTADQAEEDAQKVATALGISIPAAEKLLAEKTHDLNGDWDGAMAQLTNSAKGAVDGMSSAFDRGAATMNGAVSGFGSTVTGYAAGAKNVAAATTGAIQQMTDEQIQAAKDAHKAVLDEITNLFKDLSSLLTKSDFEKQWDDFLKGGLEKPFTTTQRRLAIEAELGSKALTDALNSDDPKRKQDAIDQVNSLIGEYNLLAPGALAAGELVGPKYAKGIDKNAQLAVDSAKATAEKAGLELVTPDEWEATGVGNAEGYLTGQKAHDADVVLAARNTAIGGAIAAREQADEFRRSGSTVAGGFNTGVGAQAPGATAAGGRLSNAARDALDIDLTQQGGNVGNSWIDGIDAALYSSAAKVGLGAHFALSALRGNSPPKEGPLKEIDHWGYNVASAWTGAFLGAIRGMNLGGALGGMRGALAGGFGSPGLSGLSVPSAAGVSGAAGLAGATSTVTNQWILNVDGVPKSVGSKQQAVDELSKLGESWG